MRIVVSGGGICGLTFAIVAKRAGLNPIVLEKSSNLFSETFGGGIGLWPPSQGVFEQLGLIQKVRSASLQMPKAAYFNQKGWKLGQPSRQFPSKYKILCLERESLCRILSEECKNLQIEIRTGTSVVDAKQTQKLVSVELSNGEKIQADLLVGADGINSVVRNIIMRDRRLPEIKPSHCGYAYFRSVVDLSKYSQVSQNNQWHNYAFESWGQQKRFGYVPLKQPKIFWFFSLPITKQGLSEYLGSHLCSESQKEWIIKQIGHWKGPLPIKQLVQMTPANTILRTDIRKIKGVTEFPWTSKNNNIIIIGDAANATAPNLAQGAGLAIQSAWDLVSMVDFSTNSGIDDFLQRRRKRAIAVQTIADLVATVGQIHSPYGYLRDVAMAASSRLFPTTQKKIFQATVRYSLGGSSSTPHWLPSLNKDIIRQSHRGNIIKSIIKQEQYLKLPKDTQDFRSSLIGRGSGLVSVKSGALGKLFGLPSPMDNKKFQAFVDVEIQNSSYKVYQKWTRIFGSGTSLAKKYSTIHEIQPDFYSSSQKGLTLVESMGDKSFLKWIKFGYDISISNNIAKYKSNSLWLWNTRLPIPKIFLPKSQWIEQQTERGWNFDGKISFPSIIGGFKFFQYKGRFQRQDIRKCNGKNVIIAGGTGFIGTSVARQFYQQGWSVTILSRKGNNIPHLPFAKIIKWDPSFEHQTLESQSDRLAKILKNAGALINLSGQNPGSSRWNDQKKTRIINSRLQSIKLLSKSIEKSNNKQITFIQASAAGIYGNRGQQILKDSNSAGSKDSFRVHTCLQIENLSKKVFKDVIIARIGHVLGQSDGIYPFLKLSSKLRAKAFGQGGQFIPWIHIQDVARSFCFLASNPAQFMGNETNIVAPEHMTYDQLYSKMGEIHSRGTYFRIPSLILKIALGQLSSVILQSQRMHPQRLIDEGFSFRFGQFKSALLSKELL